VPARGQAVVSDGRVRSGPGADRARGADRGRGAGIAPASPRLRFATVATRWLERFEAKVAAGERHPRTLEAHRYMLTGDGLSPL
jgi:hypothetical protein